MSKNLVIIISLHVRTEMLALTIVKEFDAIANLKNTRFKELPQLCHLCSPVCFHSLCSQAFSLTFCAVTILEAGKKEDSRLTNFFLSCLQKACCIAAFVQRKAR